MTLSLALCTISIAWSAERRAQGGYRLQVHIMGGLQKGGAQVQAKAKLTLWQHPGAFRHFSFHSAFRDPPLVSDYPAVRSLHRPSAVKGSALKKVSIARRP